MCVCVSVYLVCVHVGAYHVCRECVCCVCRGYVCVCVVCVVRMCVCYVYVMCVLCVSCIRVCACMFNTMWGDLESASTKRHLEWLCQVAQMPNHRIPCMDLFVCMITFI